MIVVLIRTGVLTATIRKLLTMKPNISEIDVHRVFEDSLCDDKTITSLRNRRKDLVVATNYHWDIIRGQLSKVFLQRLRSFAHTKWWLAASRLLYPFLCEHELF